MRVHRLSFWISSGAFFKFQLCLCWNCDPKGWRDLESCKEEKTGQHYLIFLYTIMHTHTHVHTGLFWNKRQEFYIQHLQLMNLLGDSFFHRILRTLFRFVFKNLKFACLAVLWLSPTLWQCVENNLKCISPFFIFSVSWRSVPRSSQNIHSKFCELSSLLCFLCFGNCQLRWKYKNVGHLKSQILWLLLFLFLLCVLPLLVDAWISEGVWCIVVYMLVYLPDGRLQFRPMDGGFYIWSWSSY